MNSPAQSALFDRIHAALPQTQCTRCGYPDCAAYAQAITAGDAAINQCPPGGAEGVQRLAAITGQPALALNPANGVEGPRSVAVIDEAWCIGCTLCLPVCPTDAILGSNKMMHTVIESCCTGCELCIPVCPVDCISLENVTGELTGWAAWSEPEAALALKRYEFHVLRGPASTTTNADKNPEKISPARSARQATEDKNASDIGEERKRSIIEAALARAKAQRRD